MLKVRVIMLKVVVDDEEINCSLMLGYHDISTDQIVARCTSC